MYSIYASLFVNTYQISGWKISLFQIFIQFGTVYSLQTLPPSFVSNCFLLEGSVATRGGFLVMVFRGGGGRRGGGAHISLDDAQCAVKRRGYACDDSVLPPRKLSSRIPIHRRPIVMQDVTLKNEAPIWLDPFGGKAKPISFPRLHHSRYRDIHR